MYGCYDTALLLIIVVFLTYVCFLATLVEHTPLCGSKYVQTSTIAVLYRWLVIEQLMADEVASLIILRSLLAA